MEFNQLKNNTIIKLKNDTIIKIDQTRDGNPFPEQTQLFVNDSVVIKNKRPMNE